MLGLQTIIFSQKKIIVIPPLTCQILYSSPGFNDNVTSTVSAPISQKLKITSSTTVCQVSQTFYNENGTTIVCEFWTGPGRTGSQIGSTSDNAIGADQGGGFGITSFYWTGTSNPTLTSDCYMTFHFPSSPGGNTINVSSNTTDPYETGLGYDAYKGATQQTGHDLVFNLFTMQ